jgi:hypothetical protein
MSTGIYQRTTSLIERLKKQGFQKKNKPWNFGKDQFTDKIIKRIADNKRGKHHAPQSEFKNGHKPYPVYGKKNINWKGGICSENYKLRRSVRYIKWRKKIFERDNYTCKKCGKKGGKLHPHHIKSWSRYPKLRFVVGNGITFCIDCHKKTDSYLNNKIRSLEDCK